MPKYYDATTGEFLRETPDEPQTTTLPLSQFEQDRARYRLRASVKDELLAEMAAENMARVRSGAWTVPDLVGLMQDPSLKGAIDLIGTLSFELAAAALAASSNPLLTPEIKAGWVGKLQANFFSG